MKNIDRTNRYKRKEDNEDKFSFKELFEIGEKRGTFSLEQKNDPRKLAELIIRYSPNKSEKLSNVLIEKLEKEYQDLCNELKTQSKENIIDRAYELTVKNEIKDRFNYMDLDVYELIPLIKQDNLLQWLYGDWMETSTPLGDILFDSLEDSILEIGRYYDQNINQDHIR